MILIFGGMYQGKLAYALERFSLDDKDVYRCNENDTVIPDGKKIIYEIDKWIFALIKLDMDISDNIEIFINNNKDAVVLCNDISCGIVPVDGLLRKWREETGRVMAKLAGQSEEVIRLFCGIPSIIKKDDERFV